MLRNLYLECADLGGNGAIVPLHVQGERERECAADGRRAVATGEGRTLALALYPARVDG